MIQSKKEDISDIIKNINFENNEKIDLIKKEYISYIKSLNSKKELSSKNFFILISIPKENDKKDIEIIKNIFLEMVLKINETLLKCGNKTLEIIEKKEVIEIINSFLSPYENLTDINLL